MSRRSTKQRRADRRRRLGYQRGYQRAAARRAMGDAIRSAVCLSELCRMVLAGVFP